MELGEDQSKVVLTADNGVAMVVMDEQDYMDKALTLLSDSNTYRIINKDSHHQANEPTNQHLQRH